MKDRATTAAAINKLLNDVARPMSVPALDRADFKQLHELINSMHPLDGPIPYDEGKPLVWRRESFYCRTGYEGMKP